MNATLFFRDGRVLSLSGMFGEICDKATELGAYRIDVDGSILRKLQGEWVWL